MGLHGGKFCRVNGVDAMRQWSIADQQRQPTAVASNTLLGTARRRGVNSWNGSYMAYGAKPATGIMPGSIMSFEGYGCPTNDVSGSGLRYIGDAMVKSVKIDWSWKDGAIIGHQVQFDGSMELVKALGADPGDAVAPNLPEILGCYVKWATTPGLTPYNILPNVVSASLTLTSATKNYVNSSTYTNGRLWTGQQGGPIDWTLSITQEDDERLTNIFDTGDSVGLKLYTSTTEFWELTYGMVGEFSGITCNRETGEIIKRTINIGMNAYYGSTAGVIKMPGGTTWWPF